MEQREGGGKKHQNRTIKCNVREWKQVHKNKPVCHKKEKCGNPWCEAVHLTNKKYERKTCTEEDFYTNPYWRDEKRCRRGEKCKKKVCYYAHVEGDIDLHQLWVNAEREEKRKWEREEEQWAKRQREKEKRELGTTEIVIIEEGYEEECEDKVERGSEAEEEEEIRNKKKEEGVERKRGKELNELTEDMKSYLNGEYKRTRHAEQEEELLKKKRRKEEKQGKEDGEKLEVEQDGTEYEEDGVEKAIKIRKNKIKKYEEECGRVAKVVEDNENYKNEMDLLLEKGRKLGEKMRERKSELRARKQMAEKEIKKGKRIMEGMEKKIVKGRTEIKTLEEMRKTVKNWCEEEDDEEESDETNERENPEGTKKRKHKEEISETSSSSDSEEESDDTSSSEEESDDTSEEEDEERDDEYKDELTEGMCGAERKRTDSEEKEVGKGQGAEGGGEA
jgi:hypothetical protein